MPFDELQAEQIALFRAAWADAGLGARAARVGQPQRHPDHDRPRPPVLRRPRRRARTRSATSRASIARFGRSYIGEPDVIAEELAQGRRRPRGRHAAADRAQPARRRVQRAPARDDRRAHRSGDRLGAGRRAGGRSVTTGPPPPGLQPLAHAEVTLRPPLDVGVTPSGHRRIVPITGGRIEGPRLRGDVLDGGADWQVVHPGRLGRRRGALHDPRRRRHAHLRAEPRLAPWPRRRHGPAAGR